MKSEANKVRKQTEAKSKRKNAGRPSRYGMQPPARVAYHLALLGATDAQLADAFGVSEGTVGNWKARPEFSVAVKKGKTIADAQVAESLFKRACGYSHTAVKIFCDARTGKKEVIEYTEHYPPDTTACIFWLKNRQPALWRDGTRHEQQPEREVKPAEMTREQAEEYLFKQGLLPPPLPWPNQRWKPGDGVA